MHVIEKRRHIRVDDRLVLSWREVDAYFVKINRALCKYSHST